MWSSRKARERKTPSRPMSRNWEVGPRKERWESVQAAVDDISGNRMNRATNGSDDGVHRTECVAPKTSKSPPEMQSTTAARQANDEDFSISLG